MMSATPASTPEPTSVSANAKAQMSGGFVDWWWVKIPAKLRAYSTVLWAAWSDGIYLTAWPRTAMILVFAVFVFGFIEGGTHWTVVGLNGYGLVSGVRAVSFAEMFPLMLLAVFLGSLSTNLGLMLVIGFALGDFLWFGVPYWPRDAFLPHNFYFHISQLAAYLAFYLLAVWPLVATKFLVASAHRRFRESELWKTVMMAVVIALFVYEWTYFAPMVVKWQWSCCDLVSQLDVRYFHATTAPWLMVAAVLGVVARRLLLLAGERTEPAVVSRLYAVCDPALASNPRTPGWLQAFIAAASMALLLLGYAGSLERVAVVFLIVAAILLFRTYLLGRLSLWKTWMKRVGGYPVMARLILATLLTYIVCRLILTVPSFDAKLGHTTQSFGPELAAILIGFAVLLVLLPNGALSTQEDGSNGSAETSGMPVPSAAVQAIAVIALILLSTKRALAATCEDPACCFGGDNGLASGATAAGTTSTASAAGSSEPQGPPAWGRPGLTYANPGGAPVHGDPSKSSPPVAHFPGGMRFRYDGTMKDAQGNTWYHANNLGIAPGWVSGKDTGPGPPQGPHFAPDPRSFGGAKTATVITTSWRG
jgi:hypothetical protein